MSKQEGLGGTGRPATDVGRRAGSAQRQMGGTVRRIALVVVAVAGLAAAFAFASTVGGSAAATPAAKPQSAADAGDVVFFSNQLATVNETSQVRSTLLKGFDGNVDFITPPVGQPQVFFNRVQAEAQAGRGTISLLGALHGDYLVIQQYLRDLSPVAKQLNKAGIPKDLLALGKLGTRKQLYIPWIQATYIMVANRKALPYLPKGANINS